MNLYPVPLPDNGTVMIIAPSSRGEILSADIAVLERAGLQVKVHPQTHLKLHQSAGQASERAHAIMDAFLQKDVQAIMCARGGNRVMHALPFLDFGLIKNNAKPLIGFSDATALLNAIYAQTGIVCFHGPTLSRLQKAQAYEIEQMLRAMRGQPDKLDFSNIEILKSGTAKGRLIGGNLSVFSALCGTSYMPSLEGAILFLEDIGDQLSRYDRMLAQLRLAGAFKGLAGIIFGVMKYEGDSSVTPFGFSLREIIEEHTQDLDIPVVMNAPFGHSGALCTLPIGGMAVLDTHQKSLDLLGRLAG